ncbi:MAG: hypothetical protein KKI02_03585 [Planctomycetes bacterium]|nr:hypothetical protein [Planctomycetota bacterium]
MTKPPDRWPLWKIVTATLGCAAGGAMLLWLSTLVGKAEGEPTADPLNRRPVLTLSGFLTILGTAGMALSFLSLIWLGYRIRQARIPAWKKRGKKKRR